MTRLSLLVAALCFGLAATTASAAGTGAERHVARGIQCTVCHGPDMKNPNYPDEKTCLACHNRDAVAAKTPGLTPNPHNAAPHNNDCTLCHMQHEPQVDYCAQCHKFGYKMPN